MTESTEEKEFFDYLTSSDGGGYAVAVPINDTGMWIGLHRLLFHWTMHIGVIGDRQEYEDRYCYADYDRAMAGLVEWLGRGFEGEPKFWRKHPKTDRCRNDDGDPESESIGWPLKKENA
jgi:hypothetical protein